MKTDINFFEQINSTGDLVNKNTFVIEHFQYLIKQGKYIEIKELINNKSILNIHPSCLFTMMLMTKLLIKIHI